MIGDTEELKGKISPVTVGFALILVAFGYYVGYIHSELRSQARQLEIQHNFALDEIEGLRADVYREDKHLQKQLDELNK